MGTWIGVVDGWGGGWMGWWGGWGLGGSAVSEFEGGGYVVGVGVV